MPFKDVALPQSTSTPSSWAKCVSASCMASKLELGIKDDCGARRDYGLKVIARWHVYNVCAFPVLIVPFIKLQSEDC